jgi:hypothetical protein
MAEDRGTAAGDQVARHRLVGGDHALLHQRVRRGRALQVHLGDAVAVEAHDRLPRVGLERAAGHPPGAQRRRDGGDGADVGLHGRVADRAAREHRVGLAVGEPALGADQRPREAGLPHLPARVDDHLHRDRGAVGLRAQAAEVGRQPRRQHRRDHARHVDRAAAAGGLAIEGSARGDETRHVGDVDPDAGRPATLVGDGDGVVVVLRAMGVDRDDPLIAQVAAAGILGDLAVVERLGLLQHRPGERAREVLRRQQPAQRRSGRAGRTVHRGDPGGAPLERHRDEVADRRPAPGALDQRDAQPGLEGRLSRRAAAGGHQLGDHHGRGASAAHPAAARESPRWRTSSGAVAGSSTTFTSGARPRFARSKPDGVR